MTHLRVRGRVEHRERRQRPPDGGVGRAVVMLQQHLPVEHRALDDGEAVAVGEDPPHVVEPGEREGVVLAAGATTR